MIEASCTALMSAPTISYFGMVGMCISVAGDALPVVPLKIAIAPPISANAPAVVPIVLVNENSGCVWAVWHLSGFCRRYTSLSQLLPNATGIDNMPQSSADKICAFIFILCLVRLCHTIINIVQTIGLSMVC